MKETTRVTSRAPPHVSLPEHLPTSPRSVFMATASAIRSKMQTDQTSRANKSWGKCG